MLLLKALEALGYGDPADPHSLQARMRHLIKAVGSSTLRVRLA